jgi:transposase
MEKHQKGSDGRRLFSAEFKQEAVRRVTSGEITAAELSRELGIQPSLLQHWKRRVAGGASVAVAANEDVVPVSELKAAQQRIKELERALGRKTMEVEILQAARDEIKKSLTGTALSPNDKSPHRGNLPHPRNRSSDTVPQHARTSRTICEGR